jgi:hypothetical protein
MRIPLPFAVPKPRSSCASTHGPELLVPTPADMRRRRSGISLLEAVVAVAIVGMTSIGALEAVGSDMRTAEKAKRAAEAEALASRLHGSAQ